MTLYFDSKVDFNESGIISTILEWHSVESLLAIASYSQNRGGIVTIIDGNGAIVDDNKDIPQSNHQASSLCWHPQRILLTVGWESGELHLWRQGSGWQPLSAPHSAPPLLLKWSVGGGRLIISDAASAVTGWRSTSSGLLMAYHLTLDEPLTHAAFCPVGIGISEGVVRGLAKAAIAGDEGALDVLAAWRPRTAPRVAGASGDNHALYAAQQNGNILYIDESGTCSEVLPSVGNVHFMEMTTSGWLIVAWETGGTLSLTRFAMGSKKGTLDAKMHVKMTTRVGLGVCSAGGSSVAILAGETTIRIWDSETNDNFTLPFDETAPKQNSEMFTCMSYNLFNTSLCCGSNQGRVFIWHKDHHGQWNMINACSVKGSVKQICWGSEGGLKPLLAVNSITSVSILREQPICWGYTNQVWGIQKGPNNVALEAPKGAITNITADLCIKAMCLNENYVAVSDGKQVQVFKLSRETFNFLPIYKFSWMTETLLIHEETMVGIVGNRIEAKTVSGIALGPLPVGDGEGEPIGISRTECYLSIATMDGSIKVVEITKKGFRSQYNPKNCYQLFEDFGEIMYAAVNCTGRLVCLAIANSNLIPQPKLYLWDASNDNLGSIILKDVEGEICVPITICWDSIDSRLVACHARSNGEDVIKCLFVNNNHFAEYKNWRGTGENRIGQNLCMVQTPYVVSMFDGKLFKNTMVEFLGSEDCDSIVRGHLLDFLYHMTLGHMEQAVIAIGHTKAGETVWQGLARACVAQKRLDVASVCLAKMNNVKGALALHFAMEDPKLSEKSRTAILAIQLGMLDEAKELLEEDGRFDLISRMTAATKGGLEKLTKNSFEGEAALLIKNAHFKLGCLRRDAGEIESAAVSFEKADVEVPHVPRMLLHAGQLETLRKRVENSQKSDLQLWWAHYLESQGELEGALEAYAAANDGGAQARLLCHTDRLQEAQALADNPAAAYYVARHLELQPEQIEEAIKYYMKAGAPSAAVRCAAEAQLWEQVVRAGNSTAINGNTAHTLLAATALEKAGRAPAAAHLYHQSGKLHKAVEVALSAEGDTGAEALARVAESVASKGAGGCSPFLAQRLVEPLLAANQPQQAVKILAAAQLFDDALELIEEHNVELSEDLAELLSPAKGMDNRTEVLQKLADLLGRRGLYHLAAKKLTQAGDKVTAMRWLVKSGDTDKMVFFASVSRDRTVYLMAARALQAADWRAQPDLLRHVASFYTRARAPRPLAAFYAACAQQEIDDYQNYEKAAGALSEALRCLSRSGDPLAATDAAMLQGQADQVQEYIGIEKAFSRGEYQNAISAGQQLLEKIEDKGPVRSYHLLRLMASKSLAAGYTSDSKEFTDRARYLEKRAENLDHERRGAESPSSDQEVPEYLPEDLPTF